MSTTPLEDLFDLPDEQRTAAMVQEAYYSQYPILRAYEQVVDEHTDKRKSINEPDRGGVSTTRAAYLALIRVGRPPRDEEDVQVADRYIHGLLDEMVMQYPQHSLDLAEVITGNEFNWAGCVTTAEDFATMREQEKRALVASHAETLQDRDDVGDHLFELLMIALPSIYAQITAADEARRRRARMAMVVGESE